MAAPVVTYPSSVIAAYEDTAANFVLTFSNPDRIIFEIVSGGKTYIREFEGDELSSGILVVNAQKYIEGFSIPNGDVFSNQLRLVNSGLIKDYTVKISTVKTGEPTSVTAFSGKALCSLLFDNFVASKKLVTNDYLKYITTADGKKLVTSKKTLSSDFQVLTNRPFNSRVNHKGYLSFHIFNTTKPSVKLLIDGVQVEVTDITTDDNLLYLLKIPNQAFNNAKQIEVSINDLTYNIKVVKRACKSYTIAWLNPIGGIDHYTFYANKEEMVEAEKEKILSNSGYKTISSVQDNSFTVYSDNENNEANKWLSEIVSSPKAWIIENNTLVPIDIISDNGIKYSDELSQLELTFRQIKPTIMQRL